MPRTVRLLWPLTLLTLASCGMSRYPVEGKVTVDGQPVGWLGEIHPSVAAEWDFDRAAEWWRSRDLRTTPHPV